MNIEQIDKIDLLEQETLALAFANNELKLDLQDKQKDLLGYRVYNSLMTMLVIALSLYVVTG